MSADRLQETSEARAWSICVNVAHGPAHRRDRRLGRGGDRRRREPRGRLVEQRGGGADRGGSGRSRRPALLARSPRPESARSAPLSQGVLGHQVRARGVRAPSPGHDDRDEDLAPGTSRSRRSSSATGPSPCSFTCSRTTRGVPSCRVRARSPPLASLPASSRFFASSPRASPRVGLPPGSDSPRRPFATTSAPSSPSSGPTRSSKPWRVLAGKASSSSKGEGERATGPERATVRLLKALPRPDRYAFDEFGPSSLPPLRRGRTRR